MSSQPFRVDGKLSLVTGGNRGIGFGIAEVLAEAGSDLILAARTHDELESAAAELRKTGRNVITAVCDLSRPDSIPAWFDELVARHGRPDILINAAGTTRRGPTETLPLDDWNFTLTVNLTSLFVMSQAFARQLFSARQSGQNETGKIINIASLTTHAARPTIAPYTASKGGVGQLTKAMAVEWADRGIWVNAVAPGYIETKMTEPLVANAEFDAWVRKRCPLGRWGIPRDVALPVLFLASPASDFITGQILYVDGGWSAAL